MFKITGLDKLQSELKDAGKALEDIDGELGSVTFDPFDPASIETAIFSMEQLIDERLGAYSNNSIVGPMAEDIKKEYRDAIIYKAAAARLEGDAG